MSARTGRNSFWTPAMVTGTAITGLLFVVAVVAPMTMSDAANILTSNAGLPPSAEHPLGTDDFGRDNLARALVATRLTLIMTASATLIAVLVGLTVGLGIWLSGPRVRRGALRLLETAVAYPSLIFALVIAAILQPGVGSTILAIGIAGIPSFARLTANLASSVSKSDFVVTARLLGVSPLRIAIRHMLPNMAEPILILSTTVFALSLVEISALSFIGLGVQNPEYDYGRLLIDSLSAIYTQPIMVVGPAFMIVIAGLGIMLIGDALAARADPRGKRTVAPRVQQRSATVEIAAGDTALVRVTDLKVGTPAGLDIVKGISFTIEPGEVLAIVGESGSGKSLTAMSVAGLLAEELTLDASTVRVGDMNMLGQPDAARLASEISIIYQDPGSTFNPALRMGSQLTEVLRVHLGFGRRAARETIETALDRVNITRPAERMKQHPYQLSGGMRQRAMIAAAMVTSPKLIIADEPTTALDVTVQLEVLRQFRRIHRDNATAMLFISHDLGVVQELCDSILVMQHGEIVERLTADQLRRRDVKHPYTQMLLAAIPAIDDGSAAQKESV